MFNPNLSVRKTALCMDFRESSLDWVPRSRYGCSFDDGLCLHLEIEWIFLQWHLSDWSIYGDREDSWLVNSYHSAGGLRGAGFRTWEVSLGFRFIA